MNGYVVFWNGKRAEIFADNLYSAKLKAIALWKVKATQQHMVSAVLAEKNGEQVTHNASML